jgi:hypothetical protein
MADANPLCGAPRHQDEILQSGIEVSQRTRPWMGTRRRSGDEVRLTKRGTHGKLPIR